MGSGYLIHLLWQVLYNTEALLHYRNLTKKQQQQKSMEHLCNTYSTNDCREQYKKLENFHSLFGIAFSKHQNILCPLNMAACLLQVIG